MSRKSDLSRMVSGLTEAEANLAILAIETYRKKLDRPVAVWVGGFDSFLESLPLDASFSAKDVINHGVSVSRTYARIKAALDAGTIVQVSQSIAGVANQPALYRKVAKTV